MSQNHFAPKGAYGSEDRYEAIGLSESEGDHWFAAPRLRNSPPASARVVHRRAVTESLKDARPDVILAAAQGLLPRRRTVQPSGTSTGPPRCASPPGLLRLEAPATSFGYSAISPYCQVSSLLLDSFRSRQLAALMSARCVRAWGKLPACSPLESISSAYKPRWLA